MFTLYLGHVKTITRQGAWVKQRRQEWIASGLCPTCGKPRAEGKSKCRVCLDKAAAWKRAKAAPKPKASRSRVTVAPAFLRDLSAWTYDKHGADPKFRDVAQALADAAESIRRLSK